MSIRVSLAAVRSNFRGGVLPAAAADALHAYTSKFAESIAAELREYPPAPPESEYVRTGRLGRAWKVEELSTGVGIRYVISNSVQDRWNRYYSAGVQSKPAQWAIHRGRWSTIQDVMESKGGREKFRSDTQRILNQLIRRGR